MKVLGFDPSLSNWGVTEAQLNIDTLEFSINRFALIETSPGKAKRVRKNSDDLERAQSISTALAEFLGDADMVFVEVPHGSQSARSMAGYGICIGILSSIEVPLIQLTEREVKLGSVGKAAVSKAEMIEWATNTFPDAPWLRQGTRIIHKNEHLADATAAIYSGVRSDEFKNVLAALRFIQKAS